MSPPAVFLQEEFIDHDLPIVSPPGDIDAEMSYVLNGIMDSVDFRVVIGDRCQLLRFFPEHRHTYAVGTNEFRFEGATAVFLNQSDQETSPRYHAYLRFTFCPSDESSGAIRLWPVIAS